MAEDPERQQRRAYLQKEREKFAKAQEWLATLRLQEVEKTESDSTIEGMDDSW